MNETSLVGDAVRGPRAFPSTHWSEIGEAVGGDDEAAGEALGRMLERYQPALLAYLQKKFHADDSMARDLLQGFVCEKVLRGDLVRRARRIPGRQFRAFLLTSLHAYAIGEFRRCTAQKRVPPGKCLSWEDVEAEGGGTLACSTQPAVMSYDRHWARQVVIEALRRFETYCRGTGQTNLWILFDARIRGPLMDGDRPANYRDLTRQCHLRSPTMAYGMLHLSRQLFLSALRSVVAEYACTPSEVQDELGHLHWVLSRCDVLGGDGEE
ncbi:MAG TPA: hypothetical protein PKW32_15805 [Verrucomicrobiota bacterium]|nr:hypothetical protein [Verrucomicrobiota bacterium]